MTPPAITTTRQAIFFVSDEANMSDADSLAFPAADPRTPKTMGILNIIFALVLMACGLCLGVYSLLLPMVGIAAESQQRLEAELVQKRNVAVAKLQEAENAATEGTKKAELKARREDLQVEEAGPVARRPMLADRRLRDPRFLGHFLLDMTSGLLLNVMMLVSGVGLIFLKGWGRSLAVFVAWSKIVRLLAIALSMTFVVAPFATTAIAEVLAEAKAANPNPAPGDLGPEFATTVGMVLTSACWVLFLLGSIYPGLTIWLLGRPSVREACRGGKTRPSQPSW
ncbi:MAG: hypothetical protein JWN86_4463 [Planctomycetota bacterium]|nr:hypothetical protein [Planctomycetota bacterium]